MIQITLFTTRIPKLALCCSGFKLYNILHITFYEIVLFFVCVLGPSFSIKFKIKWGGKMTFGGWGDET